MRRLLLAALLCVLASLPASALGASPTKPPDRIVLSGDVLVAKGETVGDVVVGKGNVIVRGEIHGDLVVIDGDATLRGSVGGDLVTGSGTATLGRRARIGGDIKWLTHRPVLAGGATVVGKVRRFDTGTFGALPSFAILAGFWLIASVSFVLGGLLLLWFAPTSGPAVLRAARDSRGRAIIAGIALLILLPVVTGLLLVSVVGTPLGIGLLLAVLPIYGVAYMAGAFVLGHRVVGSGGRFRAFLAGMVILRLFALIPVLGALISLVATVFGLGTLFVAARRARPA